MMRMKMMRLPTWRAMKVSGLLLLAIVPSCSPLREPPHLLLITIDTIRADHVGCYGYFRDTTPSLDSLATRSIVFEDCMTTMATTLPAHASLLTGLYPVDHGLFGNLADQGHPFTTHEGARSIAEVLRDAGYATGGFVSATPLSALTGIQAGFDVYDEPEARERPAGETITIALDWLRKTEGPTFTWVHLFDPHDPYEPPPPFNKMFQVDKKLESTMTERGIALRVRSGAQWVRDNRRSINAYDGEIRAMDAEVGKFLAGLHAMGRTKNTVIAVIGDHGEGLTQHDRLHHGELWHEQIAVPAFFTGPGVKPDRWEETISSVDFLPTILGHFPSIPAKSFCRAVRGEGVRKRDEAARPVVSQLSDGRIARGDAGIAFALTSKEWKIIYTNNEPARLYDRKNDPFETIDVADDHRDLVREFEPVARSFQARYDSTKAAQSDNAVTLPPEYRDKMKALGYLD